MFYLWFLGLTAAIVLAVFSGLVYPRNLEPRMSMQDYAEARSVLKVMKGIAFGAVALTLVWGCILWLAPAAADQQLLILIVSFVCVLLGYRWTLRLYRRVEANASEEPIRLINRW